MMKTAEQFSYERHPEQADRPVLNRHWQAIHVRTPAEAFCQMAANAATGLEIEGQDHIRPVTWDEWITLPIRHRTRPCTRCAVSIRVPTVIVAVNYARVPKKRREVLCPHAPGAGR